MTEQACPVLTGTRVQLRPIHRHDAVAMHRLWSQPAFADSAGGAPVPDLETMQAVIDLFDSMNRAGLFCKWTLTRLGEPDWIGECELHPVSPQLRPWCEWSLGYTLAPPLRGQGLMLEAVSLALDWVTHAQGAQRVSADVPPGNEPSRRLLARLGFKQEGLQRAKACVQGMPQDRELWARVSEPS